jgi:hypothetical protein
MRACVSHRIMWGCAFFFAEHVCCPLHPLHRLRITLQLVCLLSFAHVIRSSIRALADGRPAVTPMRVLRPPSPPLRWAVSRAFTFSHSPPSLPLVLLHPPARPFNGASINAGRAQLGAQPDAEHHPAPGGALRSQSCRAPPLPSCASLLLLLLLLHPHLRSAPPGVPARWVSVDLCGVFSHGHLGECVCCSVA